MSSMIEWQVAVFTEAVVAEHRDAMDAQDSEDLIRSSKSLAEAVADVVGWARRAGPLGTNRQAFFGELIGRALAALATARQLAARFRAGGQPMADEAFDLQDVAVLASATRWWP